VSTVPTHPWAGTSLVPGPGWPADSAKVLETLDDLTPEFLTAAWHAHGWRGSEITSFSGGHLVDGKGITGQVARLTLHYAHREPEAPTSVIVKFTPSDPEARAQLHEMGFFERELGFYQSLADRTPVATSVCFGAAMDSATGAALLLLEDLAPACNGSTVAGSSLDEIDLVLTALAGLHARWWRRVELLNLSWLRLKSFTAPDAMARVFQQSWPSFLNKLTAAAPREIEAAGWWISHNLGAAASALFTDGPLTLIHNDVQGDNLFFTGDRARPVVFLDWQLATLGRGVIDVAGFVRAHLEPEVRRAVEPDLLRRYHGALVEAGVSDYRWDQCQADYAIATVLAPARLASAVGLHPGLSAHPGSFWEIIFPRLLPDDLQ